MVLMSSVAHSSPVHDGSVSVNLLRGAFLPNYGLYVKIKTFHCIFIN